LLSHAINYKEKHSSLTKAGAV